MRAAFALVLLGLVTFSPQAQPQPGVGGVPGQPAPGINEELYVIGSIVAFQGRARVPIGFELRPFGSMPAPPRPAAARIIPLPVTPPVLATVDLRVPASPPLIRRALDDFVAVNPSYEWSVTGPLVRVLPSGAANDEANWLNAEVRSLELRGATVREALVALRRVFEPGYDEAKVVAGRTPSALAPSGSLAPTPVPQPSTIPQRVAPAPAATLQMRIEEAQARRFDVTLQAARVRDALDAIVLGHGEAGWLVTFHGKAPVAEQARITIVFWQASTMISYPTAGPARVSPPSVPAAGGPAPRFLTVPLTRDALRAALSSVASAAGRPIGFRLGPECGGRETPAPARVLNLEGVGVEEAVDLALAECAGYERRDVDGVLNVVPAGSVDRDVVLDGRTAHFKVVNAPFRTTLFDVQKMVARFPMRSRPSLPAASAGGLPARAQAAALDQAKPVTVDVKKATLRAALNALVAAHGAAWWAIDGPFPQGLVRLTIGGSGWSESWTVQPK